MTDFSTLFTSKCYYVSFFRESSSAPAVAVPVAATAAAGVAATAAAGVDGEVKEATVVDAEPPAKRRRKAEPAADPALSSNDFSSSRRTTTRHAFHSRTTSPSKAVAALDARMSSIEGSVGDMQDSLSTILELLRKKDGGP